MVREAANMVLQEPVMVKAEKAQPAAVQELMVEAPKANVVGVGVGIKWRKGEPTGDPAMIVLVTHKLSEDELAKDDVVPGKVAGMQTDVLAVGHLMAGNGELGPPSIQSLAKRVRPARGGYSVGHKNITAGTIATCVYDILPGGSVSPPVHGVGVPSRFYILSNNHVLANSNAAALGDAVLQPGPYDGGTDPADRIAVLSRYVPITFYPPTPLTMHQNLVDAAIAEGAFHDLDRAIYWSCCVRGWRRKAGFMP